MFHLIRVFIIYLHAVGNDPYQPFENKSATVKIPVNSIRNIHPSFICQLFVVIGNLEKGPVDGLKWVALGRFDGQYVSHHCAALATLLKQV